MNSILDVITSSKKEEIAVNRRTFSVEALQSAPLFLRKCNSLKNNLLLPYSSGVIAEFKQKSPSRGLINATAGAGEVTRGYVTAGASGVSVLTDQPFFGGSLENLKTTRMANPGIPLLRKDFMVDEYQIYEAKAYGADVILLIAACLSKGQAEDLAGKARALGLEVLFEIHDEDEISLIPDSADFVGVNNRNLKTMSVSLETSYNLASLLPDRLVKISESGISTPEDVSKLKEAGYRGFLIGENFMLTGDPAKACREFILKLNKNPVKPRV